MVNKFWDRPSIWASGAMANTTIYSSAFNVQRVLNFGIQVVWSAGATPVGTFTLQYSNDGTNYDDDANSDTAITGNSGSTSWEKSFPALAWVRVKYVGASGTATVNASINAKGWV